MKRSFTFFMLLLGIATAQARPNILGAFVNKSPACTLADFTAQLNSGGLTITDPVKTTELGSQAIVNATDVYQYPRFGSSSNPVVVLTQTMTLAEAFSRFAEFSGKIFVFNGATLVTATRTLQGILDHNASLLKLTLLQNGGCAIYGGVGQIGVRAAANTNATYPGIISALNWQASLNMLPTRPPVKVGVIDTLMNRTFIDQSVLSRLANGITIDILGQPEAVVEGGLALNYTHGTEMINLHVLYPNAPIFPVASDAGDLSLATAVRAIRRERVNAIAFATYYPSFGNSQSLSDAIDKAVRDGIVFVQASGNDHTSVEPFKYHQDSAITVNYSVGGIARGTVASADVTVPFEGTYTLPGISGDLPSDNLMSSGATQVVAQLAGMLKQTASCLTPVEIKDIIKSTATPLLNLHTNSNMIDQLGNLLISGGDINPVAAVTEARRYCNYNASWDRLYLDTIGTSGALANNTSFADAFKGGCERVGGLTNIDNRALIISCTREVPYIFVRLLRDHRTGAFLPATPYYPGGREFSGTGS